jgi:hypothetical protein
VIRDTHNTVKSHFKKYLEDDWEGREGGGREGREGRKGREGVKLTHVRIYYQMSRSDTAFRYSENKKLQNPVMFHSFFLLSQSRELSKLFNSDFTEILTPSTLAITESEFHSLLKFIYFGYVIFLFLLTIARDEEEINPFVARKLQSFAADYGLAKLSEVCENQLEGGIRPETALHVLELGKINYARG